MNTLAAGSDPTPLQFDPLLLTSIVERSLGRHGITLTNWRSSSVPYMTFLSGRALWSVSGTAAAASEVIHWRLILKIIYPPWTREVEAYQSGLLDHLPGNLRAPRAFHIDVDARGAVWLWLEHITDLYDRRWPLAAYGVAARHLGQFNGAYLAERSIPTEPWLRADWAEQDSETVRAAVARPILEVLLKDGRMQSAFLFPIAVRARRLVDDQPRFLAILARLPRTLCHHDASQANLFARKREDGEIETVAIDWEDIGPGTIGADLATLVFGTMRRGTIPATEADQLERVAYDGYVAGLRDAGWQGPEDQVRLGYAAAVSLRWSLLFVTLRNLVDDEARANAARDWHFPPEDLLRQWIPFSIFLLDRAASVDRLTDSGGKSG